MLPLREEYSFPMQQLCNHIPFKMSIVGLKGKKKVECIQWPLSIFFRQPGMEMKDFLMT